VAKISKEQMKANGVDHALYDLEDPWRLENLSKAYPEEDPKNVQKRAAGRINFWRRAGLDCFIVNDPDIPYVRPASEDTAKIQAYDVLSFSLLDKSDPKWKKMFNAEGTAITKQAYRNFYLEITRLQYGNLEEDKLRAQFPAVKQFLETLDGNPKQWVNLHMGPVRPNAHATLPVRIDVEQPKRPNFLQSMLMHLKT
jgi:hypothetical protein